MTESQSTTSTTSIKSSSRATSRLVFPHGVANLTLSVDESMTGLYRGDFFGLKPVVTEDEDQITIDYPRFNPLVWGRTSATVTISPAAVWTIEIQGGVSRWDGDLRAIELAGIDIRGGASHIELHLPAPRGGVLVHASGGVSDLTLRRPAGIGARVQIGGGVTRLALDDQGFGAIGGPVALESPAYAQTADRYVIEIGGGASRVTIAGD